MNKGDYIRTKYGTIDKIVNNDYYISYLVECEKHTLDRDIIIKSSPNIIDLIEVGDYANGERVIRIFNPTFLSTGELPLYELLDNELQAQYLVIHM